LFNNEIAIMTGGAQGIRKEIALQMANDVAVPVMLDINEEKSKKTAEEIQNKGQLYYRSSTR
jgi:NAD(P)-dependent dehydrogenase (short-subunit alcohol dehydrogenase family)